MGGGRASRGPAYNYAATLSGVYDNVHLRFRPLESTPDGEQALLAAPAFATQCGGGRASLSTQRELRNLRVKYWPGQYQGTIRGSLHSFSKGNNLVRLSLSDIRAAVAEIAYAFNLPASHFEVYRLEGGFNLPTPDDPQSFLKSLGIHKGVPFIPCYPPTGFRDPLQYVALHSDYAIKLYNKGIYQGRKARRLGIVGSLLRFEVKLMRMRPFQQYLAPGLVSTLTLDDLVSPIILESMATYLTSHWRAIERFVPIDYDQAESVMEKAILVAGRDSEFWASVKRTNSPSTYKRARATYREQVASQSQLQERHPYEDLLSEEVEAFLRG